MLNILLAAIYQLINIRVDPFGARHIITTPRTIGACVLTWLIPLIVIGPLVFGALRGNDYIIILLLEVQLGALLLTGLCYNFIYQAVSKGPPGVAVSEQRKQEN